MRIGVGALVATVGGALLVGACSGAAGGDDDVVGSGTPTPVPVGMMKETLAGNPPADVLEYESQLELNLATPQLNNLAGLNWGTQSAASLLGTPDAIAALQILAATPQLFAVPVGTGCADVQTDVGEAIAAIAGSFAAEQLPPQCSAAPDANACIAASFLVVAAAVDPDDRSGGATQILACAGSETPTPTPAGTATATPSGTATATPSGTATATPSGTATATRP